MPGMYESDADAVIKRQSVEQKVTNIKAAATPFASTIKDGGSQKQSLHEFTMERYEDRPVTAAVDGEDVESFDYVGRTPAYTRSQEIRDTWGVTQKTEVTEFVGTPPEAKNQKAKSLVHLKFKREKLLLSDQDLGADTGNTGDMTRGVFKWLNPTQGTTLPVPEDFRPVAAQWITVPTDEVTEAVVEAALGACYDQVFEEVALFGMVGRMLKAQLDTFTMKQSGDTTDNIPVRQYSQSVKDKTFIKCVDFLTFSSGTIILKQHSYLLNDLSTGAASAYTTRSGAFLNLQQWQTNHRRPIQHKNLEDKGGGPRGFWREDLSLSGLHPQGQFAIYSNAAT